jgi:hypothetical protein
MFENVSNLEQTTKRIFGKVTWDVTVLIGDVQVWLLCHKACRPKKRASANNPKIQNDD